MQVHGAPRRIRTLCAWCGAVLVDVPMDARGISHGICEVCLVREFGERANQPSYDDLQARAVRVVCQQCGHAYDMTHPPPDGVCQRCRERP